jgi:hypothetical protein
VEVAPSARQHGISDEDMLHAARHAITQIHSTGVAVMFIGPGRDGTLLEVGVLGPETETPSIIHA